MTPRNACRIGIPRDCSADRPTGFHTPLTVNGSPVLDISDPWHPKLAVLQPGRKYQLSGLPGCWLITSDEKS